MWINEEARKAYDEGHYGGRDYRRTTQMETRLENTYIIPHVAMDINKRVYISEADKADIVQRVVQEIKTFILDRDNSI